MKKLLLLLCLAGDLCLASPLFETTLVFPNAPKNRPNYRIPSILQAPNGDVLIFAEKRNDGPGDVGNTDIVCKRSRDKGRTWSAEQVIFDDGSRCCTDITVGIERDASKIWLFFLRDKKQYAYFTSTDNGATWQGPVSIHEQVTRPEWDKLDGKTKSRTEWEKGWAQRYGVGPGNAMAQLKSGRLVVPARHREDIGGGRLRSFSHCFYSDDRGATWKLGGTVGVNTSECQLVELANGDLMLVSRDESSEDSPANLRHRVVVSKDGGATWGPVRRAEQLITPRCHGAVERYDKGRLLFSGLASPVRQEEHPYGRTNLTVRVSCDEGATWSAGKTIWPYPASYSDIAVLDDGTIVLVYERGDKGSTHYWDELHFVRFNLEWLTDDRDITWLVNYQGGSLPDSTWSAIGKVNTTTKGAALHLVDDSNQEGCFRAKWKAEPDQEIVVEARVKVGAVKAFRGGQSIWPWRDGAPIGVLVSDGRHQEGLVLIPSRLATFTDRFFKANTSSSFHTYRLVIRGNDMSVFMDDKLCIRGAGAFWKPAESPEPFLQFGSNAKTFTGSAQWEFVRLGVRKPTTPTVTSGLKITISKPWDITRVDKVRMTRPYLYNMGKGLLLMSVAEGPDAYFEPYGVLKSTDEGKTWMPVKGLEKLEEAPQPMVRMADGSIIGVSRWNRRRADGVLVGHTVRLDERAEKFTMFEHEIHLPAESVNEKRPVSLVFDRHIFAEPDGSITAVGYGYTRTGRAGHLLRSTDGGRTWRYFSSIPNAGEPAVARLSPTELTTVYRQGTLMPMMQVWSHDAGKTWSAPVTLDVGSVSPDIVLMSNGVLACSYGRPASCIMFSLDKGKTWESHRVITDKAGFNYSAIREIRPGRLLYVHDAPEMNAVYVDVERW